MWKENGYTCEHIREISKVKMKGYSVFNGFHKKAWHVLSPISEKAKKTMDAEISETALQRAKNKFTSIYNAYIAGSDAKVYMSVIPDKNYFLAEENGYNLISFMGP